MGAWGINRPQPYAPNSISISTSSGLPIPSYFQTPYTNVEATLASHRQSMDSELDDIRQILTAQATNAQQLADIEDAINQLRIQAYNNYNQQAQRSAAADASMPTAAGSAAGSVPSFGYPAASAATGQTTEQQDESMTSISPPAPPPPPPPPPPPAAAGPQQQPSAASSSGLNRIYPDPAQQPGHGGGISSIGSIGSSSSSAASSSSRGDSGPYGNYSVGQNSRVSGGRSRRQPSNASSQASVVGGRGGGRGSGGRTSARGGGSRRGTSSGSVQSVTNLPPTIVVGPPISSSSMPPTQIVPPLNNNNNGASYTSSMPAPTQIVNNAMPYSQQPQTQVFGRGASAASSVGPVRNSQQQGRRYSPY